MAIRSVNYSLVYDNVLNLCGIEQDQDGTNLVVPGRVQWRLIRDFVNNRLKLGWESARWPELCKTESRTVTEDSGDEGYYVSFSQTGLDVISTVFAVWDSNPKVKRNAEEVDYYLSENGVQLEANKTTVWIFYRKPHPILSGNLYSNASGTNYAIGAQAYDNTLGDFYEATEAITGDGTTDNSPNAQPSKWSKVEIPDVLRNYLIRGAYADYLRHDGDMEKAHIAERDATAALDHEVGQVEIIQGQDVRLNNIHSY